MPVSASSGSPGQASSCMTTPLAPGGLRLSKAADEGAAGSEVAALEGAVGTDVALADGASGPVNGGGRMGALTSRPSAR
jgi:hypothetical protein